MNPDEVIELPGAPGKFARRAVVMAWIAAGSPPVNSATRLLGEQQYFWDGWRLRLPGFSPADNPANLNNPLAHVRGVALDITPTPERVRRLAAAGLVRPYDYEPWHWQLPGNVRRFSLVSEFPNSSGVVSVPAKTKKVDFDMFAIRKAGVPNSGIIIQAGVPPYSMTDQVFEAQWSTYGLEVKDLPDWRYDTAVREQWTAYAMSLTGAVNVGPSTVEAIANKVRDEMAKAMDIRKDEN